MIDTYAARRRLTRIHNDLRNRGLNPIEALDELGCRLSEIAIHEGLPGIEDSPADLVSLVYQEILAPGARNGLGQYLTPLPVADMMAHVVSEKAIPRDVLDPFCGVGILLDRVAAISPTVRLWGIEISEPVARMASSLSSLGGNSISLQLRDTFSGLADGTLPTVDVVVSNPPFGATVSKSSFEDLEIPVSLRSLGKLPAELLGLEVCIQCLQTGGFLAIVLPQSILTNRRWSHYRSDVLARLTIDAIVSLPEETFGPFRGVANACVVFGTRQDSSPRQVFPMYVSESVGYSATGRQAAPSDLGQIAKQVVLGEDAERYVSVTETGDAQIDSQLSLGNDGLRLGDIAEVFVGKNPPRSQYVLEGPWLLKVGDLAGSVVPWRARQNNRVSVTWFNKQHRVHLQRGDVCLTAAGHRPKYIGLKVDMIDDLPAEGAAPSGEVMVIRLRSNATVEPEELLFYLRSKTGYRSIQELVRGSTGHLYAQDLAEMRIPSLQELYSPDAIRAFRQAVSHFREYRKFESQAERALSESSAVVQF